MIIGDMRFEGIEFPHALIGAQEQRELVIFAGAGVSIPEPSNLPNFRDLAHELANDATSLQQGEAVDRFLGRLPDDFNIYERTQSRLTSDTAPNSLHRDLLNVFLRPHDVRLVTTNFDDHFASAAREIFADDCPRMFFAPALPIGGDFRGIVHLHGSVRQNPREMVLTDRDFGKAYLTEGWARRFVLALFLRYSVLFIGYSHNDPVMQYLARGLPPGNASNKRFALDLADSKTDWENLGIELLPYFERKEKNRHAQLQVACTKWAGRVRATPLETREHIKRIVQRPPQPAGEEIDLIEKALEDSTLVQFFTEFAVSPAWLRWASGHKAFKRIFRDDASPTECDQQIALWFARKFAIQHAAASLDLVRDNGSYIPRLLWTNLAGVTWQSMKMAEASMVCHRWVALLIANEPRVSHEFLEYMLADCCFPKDDGPALLLMQHLLRPTLILRESLGQEIAELGGEPNIRIDLKLRGSPHWLSTVWQKFKAGGLAFYADPGLVPIFGTKS